jgi:CelD/BcsL family acetyltransferase involved in cellulose biosynthesis
VRSAANWHTPVYDVVADDSEAARELADAVFALRPRRLELRFLDDDSLALRAFRPAAVAAGYRVLTRPIQESPYVPIEGDWDSYIASRSRSMLKELGRRWRGLERAGGTVAVTFENGRNLDEALEEGFHLEGSGWKGRSGTAMASRPETRRFYTDVARWAADRGWLRLAYLRLGGTAIAFQFDLEADRVVYHLKPGYDESYGRFRPGKLLTQEVIRAAFERGARSYEFLGGADAHKLDWTDRVRQRHLLQAFAPTPAGLAELAAFRYGRPAARSTLQTVRRIRGAAG